MIPENGTQECEIEKEKKKCFTYQNGVEAGGTQIKENEQLRNNLIEKVKKKTQVEKETISRKGWLLLLFFKKHCFGLDISLDC